MCSYYELTLMEVKQLRNIVSSCYTLTRGIIPGVTVIRRLIHEMPKDLFEDLVAWGVASNPAINELCQYILCSKY